MLSNLLIGKNKEDVIDKIYSKDYITHSEIVDMVNIGSSDLIKKCLEYDLIDDISDTTTLIETLTRKEIIVDDYDGILSKISDDVKDSINWRYYYSRALVNNITFAETLLNNKLVTVGSKDYGILTHYILKKNVKKVKKIIEKYNINIWEIENVSRLAVGSFFYSKECFNYFMSLYDINDNKNAIKSIVNIHDELDIIKYLFENDYFSEKYIYIYYIILLNVH